jgi:8-amino-7-oxononanoate synthase
VAEVDFTSALYLGFRHPSESLARYGALTAGKPASLYSPPEAATLAAELIGMIGLEAATLGTSTLHLFWDLFGLLCQQRCGIIVIGNVYPIGLWGVERAVSHGVPLARLGHDPPRVAAQATLWQHQGRRPVLMTDGLILPQGKVPPLAEYARIAAANAGRLVIDDTQALGILGGGPSPAAPYGHGGGGSYRFHGIGGQQLIAVASLAKGFGAPLAILAGSRSFVSAYEVSSETRRHNSPPSLANIAAAARALALNRRHGEELRERLLGNIRRFRGRLAALGLRPGGGLFPTQTLPLATHIDTRAVLVDAAEAGIEALITTDRWSDTVLLAFIITATHRGRDIDVAATVAQHLAAKYGTPPGKASRTSVLLQSRLPLRATCSTPARS